MYYMIFVRLHNVFIQSNLNLMFFYFSNIYYLVSVNELKFTDIKLDIQPYRPYSSQTN